jgi:hypothetical protein
MASTHKNKGGKCDFFFFSTGILLSATTLGHWLKYMKELAIGNINVKTEQVSEREWIKR